MSKIYPVLLAGGSGTRLWPLSRKSFPKQFSKLIEDVFFNSHVEKDIGRFKRSVDVIVANRITEEIKDVTENYLHVIYLDRISREQP